MSKSFLDLYSNPLGSLSEALENCCEQFNTFIFILFPILKFIFVALLLLLGILTLLKLRGEYFLARTKGQIAESKLDIPRLILGFLYINFGFGILFNYLVYFLMYVLDPIPDRLIFNFVSFPGIIDPYSLNRIKDLNLAIYPHEKSLYFAFAICSFLAFLDILVSTWILLSKTRQDIRKAITTLFSGVVVCVLVGFTTFLPLFL